MQKTIDILNEIKYNKSNKTSRTSVSFQVSQGGYFFTAYTVEKGNLITILPFHCYSKKPLRANITHSERLYFS